MTSPEFTKVDEKPTGNIAKTGLLVNHYKPEAQTELCFFFLGENDLNSEEGRIYKSPSDRYVPNSSLAKIAVPAGTERSQIPQIAPKWLGESAKGRLRLRCGSAEKVSCTGAKEVRTGASRACTGARDFSELLHWSPKRPLALSLTTLGKFGGFDSSPCSPGLQR